MIRRALAVLALCALLGPFGAILARPAGAQTTDPAPAPVTTSADDATGPIPADLAGLAAVLVTALLVPTLGVYVLVRFVGAAAREA